MTNTTESSQDIYIVRSDSLSCVYTKTDDLSDQGWIQHDLVGGVFCQLW